VPGLRAFVGLGIAALVLVGLHGLQVVLVPFALAALLAFLLSPIVDALQRRGLWRVPSVVIVVALALSLLGGLGWALARQLTGLADELPRYSTTIRRRIVDLRGASRQGSLAKVQSSITEVVGEIQKADPPADPRQRPVPVRPVAEPGPAALLAHLPTLVEALIGFGVVTLIVCFMLLERRELAERTVQLVGFRRIAMTTRALDEAGARISRYLRMQFLVNGGFGLAAGLGLFAIGIPYPALWGPLAAALRFIPYVGVWLAILPPLALALAVSPGWVAPLLVLGLFVGLELLVNAAVEPLLYSQSAGVSPVGLLVALTFWTWLWGPVGLLLGTPLTVCLIVLSKYVPPLSFIAVLLGDESRIDARTRYYQRLLGRDAGGAAAVVEAHVEEHGTETLDDILLPALRHASRDYLGGHLAYEDHAFVARTTAAILERVTPAPPPGPAGPAGVRPGVCVIGCPAWDELDEVALDLLRRKLVPTACRVEVLPAGLPTGEVAALVARSDAPIVCVAGLGPGSLGRMRRLCRQIRLRSPQVAVVIGQWGIEDDGSVERKVLLSAGASRVERTLPETRRAIVDLAARPVPARAS